MRSILFLTAFLSGCTTIGHELVADWPELRVVERRVPHNEMRDRCAKYISGLGSPEACAEFHFAEGVCNIWFSADFPPSADIVEHERKHCSGYDHVGETSMRAMLAKYRGKR